MSLTFGLFTQVSGSGPLGPLVGNTFGGKMRSLVAKDTGSLNTVSKIVKFVGEFKLVVKCRWSLISDGH